MKPSEIYNFIVSNSSTAKNLLENLMNIPPKCEHKYLYIRVIYKSIAQNSKYFPEYEKILEILYDETTVYSSESIVGWNQLLRTLCSMSFFKEYYKCLKLIKEVNLPNDIQILEPLFMAAMKNNLYIISKDSDLAKDNRVAVFSFAKAILNRTKDFSFFAKETIMNFKFLYYLQSLEMSKEFFETIDKIEVPESKDIDSFVDDLRICLIRILQLNGIESANQFLKIILQNKDLRSEKDFILYSKTLNADDSTIGKCMEATKHFITQNRKIISTQNIILNLLFFKSSIKFSKESCEEILDVFLVFLQHLKSLNSEFNYFTCCTNFRQHICGLIFESCLYLILAYVKSDPETAFSEDFEDGIRQVTDYFLQIVKQLICPITKHYSKIIYSTMVEIYNLLKVDSSAQFLIELFKDIFDEPKLRNETYTSEEVRALIVFHSKLKPGSDLSFLEELNALYVGHMIRNKNNQAKIQEKIFKYYKDTNPKRTILEVIEANETHRKPTNFDVELLKREERELCIKHFKHMIPKLVENANSDLEYLLILPGDQDSVDHDKIESIYKRTLESLRVNKLEDESKAEKYLTLACVTKIQVMWQIHCLKEIVSIKSSTEDEYMDSIESHFTEFSKLPISKETLLISKAQECLKYYAKLVDIDTKSFKKFRPDWSKIVADLIHLGRHFEIRGYFNDKANTMKLLCKIMEFYENDLTLIHVVSFFLAKSNQNYTEYNSKIKKLLPKVEDILFDMYSKLPEMKSPRTENLILFCFLNLAYYYFLKGDKDNSSGLLHLVKEAIDENLIEHKEKKSVIRFYFFLIQFRICCKEKSESKQAKKCDDIYNCLKKFIYISTEDNLLYPIYQYEFINEVFNYHVLRFNTDKLYPYLRHLIDNALLNGCIFRIIQMVSFYCYAHYQAENVSKFMTLTKIVERIIGIDFTPRENNCDNKIKKLEINKPLLKKSTELIDLTNDEVSLTIRRDIKNNNDIKKIFTPEKATFNIETFIEEASKQSSLVQSALLLISGTYIKLLSENGTNKVDLYFKKLYEFRKSVNSKDHAVIQMIFFMLYVYFLRHKQFKNTSVKMLVDRAMKNFEDNSERLSFDFKLNLDSQYFCSE